MMLACAWASRPGQTLPQMFRSRYELNAAYDFFKRPEATPDRIQAGHRKRTLEQARLGGQTILLIEDTSEVSWSGHAPISGLGPIGGGAAGLQGFLLHSVLAVRWPGVKGTEQSRPPVEILGLADQQYHIRKPRPAERAKRDQRSRTKREFESELWERAGERMGPAPEAARWVRVLDRGADIYELLAQCGRMGHGFVVRAAQDRALEGERADQLFAAARAAKVLGSFDLSLRTRPGKPARVARLSVAATAVRIRSPRRVGHAVGTLEPICCAALRVFEAKAPDGAEALEWILLTDAKVATFTQGLEVAMQYATRWVIEEFHKALKTGMKIEDLQLEEASRLFAAISVMSVAALRLIDLRERARLIPGAPPEESGLDATELKVLSMHTGRTLRTVRDVAMTLGHLGGHRNRKADGTPGWQTLWRGLHELGLVVQGYVLSQKVTRSRE